jgi:hypothetical protein
MRFRDKGQRELWQLSVGGAIKALNDARTLDPHGGARLQEMESILDALMTDGPIASVDAQELDRRIQKVFDLYKADSRLKYPKIG